MYGIVLDIITLAKPLASGLPIGATLVTEIVASTIGYGDHGCTFAVDHLSAKCPHRFGQNIKTYYLANVSKKGQYFKELLIKNLGGNSHVRDIQGPGLIIGTELYLLHCL